MNFSYNKATCQNLNEALRLEWLETNGRGDYASSSIVGCNTRKYHGLFVAALDQPAGRHVLLSTIDETLTIGRHNYALSCRKHPGCFFPQGHEYLRETRIGAWPRFRYRIGDVVLTREVMMPRSKRCLLIRYSVECAKDTPTMQLTVKPLLAFRGFHTLTHANMDLRPRTFPAANGFKIQPYDQMPPMFMQVNGKFTFLPSPDWYYNVEYVVEHERGFEYSEDLFQPGVFAIELTPDHPVVVTASLEEIPVGTAETLWNDEAKLRIKKAISGRGIIGHLAREGERFLVRNSRGEPEVIAGYPWFDAWGRDTMIALPGLTFCADRAEIGVEILARAGAAMKDGLIPNVYGADGVNSYNCVDASLWYVWAAQQMEATVKHGTELLKEHCLGPIRQIINAYAGGKAPCTTMDECGLLRVGNENTQLTWMDATVDGKPVTPRWGYPVEIQALWYNALCFENKTAKKLGETPLWSDERLEAMRAEFKKRFWNEERGHVYDVWRSPAEGGPEPFCRPNQLVAAGLPEAILDRELAAILLENVHKRLLTPFGMRTLAPINPKYCSLYEGGPAERDFAYHMGTAWPWLLGMYADALLYATWEHDRIARRFLQDITPLCTKHLREYGIGSICEIFDAAPPNRPNGCIAQAWSVAEVLRALKNMKKAAPTVYKNWEAKLKEEGV